MSPLNCSRPRSYTHRGFTAKFQSNELILSVFLSHFVFVACFCKIFLLILLMVFGSSIWGRKWKWKWKWKLKWFSFQISLRITRRCELLCNTVWFRQRLTSIDLELILFRFRICLRESNAFSFVPLLDSFGHISSSPHIFWICVVLALLVTNLMWILLAFCESKLSELDLLFFLGESNLSVANV